jgi:hypothetical protein
MMQKPMSLNYEPASEPLHIKSYRTQNGSWQGADFWPKTKPRAWMKELAILSFE